jgi:hypothetical protein
MMPARSLGFAVKNQSRASERVSGTAPCHAGAGRRYGASRRPGALNAGIDVAQESDRYLTGVRHIVVLSIFNLLRFPIVSQRKHAMTFAESVSTCFKKYVDFTGCASRSARSC